MHAMLSKFGGAKASLLRLTRKFSSTSSYPKLLQPLAVVSQVLKNRVIMGSMHTNLEERSLEDLAGNVIGNAKFPFCIV